MPDPVKDSKSPATTSDAYDTMLPKWQRIATLLEGTLAMRDAGRDYLPQHPGESNPAYDERLNRATLLNMLQFTLDAWAGKPFSKPVSVGDDVPSELVNLLDNVDLQGNSINIFARDWFRDGLAKGFSHVLIDFPRKTLTNTGFPRTIEDDRIDKIRPYLVHIPPENLIFAYGEIIDGVERLTHARIREVETVLDGFIEREINKIKCIENGLVTIYEEVFDPKTKKFIWIQTDQWTYDLPYIPLITFYADRQGFMLSKPPLSDLADLNIAHWQSRSDQTAVLTVARFPILALNGAIDETKLVVGPNQWLNCPDPAGRYYYVEHSGKAIEAGRQHELDLEDLMSQYGATFLRRRPGGASATARALDSAETTSPLQDVSMRFGDALQMVMRVMGDWLGLADVGTFSVLTDFRVLDNGGVRLTTLDNARNRYDISGLRYTGELKRFGVLDEDYNFDQDQAQIKSEPPPIIPLAPTITQPQTLV